MLRAWHAQQAVVEDNRLLECASRRRPLKHAAALPNRRCPRCEIAGGPLHTVRHAGHADVPAMYRLSQEGNIGWSLGQLQAELEFDFSTVLVSASEAQVYGFACGWHVGGELQVMALAVSHDMQSLGIGTALLEELLRIGSGLGDTLACLELREGNEPALRLYNRTGFREVGRRRRYYDNGDAAILMSRML